MHKTNSKGSDLTTYYSVNTATLVEKLDCGKATAVKIGEKAGAKIRMGKRVLWNVSKILQYLDEISN